MLRAMHFITLPVVAAALAPAVAAQGAAGSPTQPIVAHAGELAWQPGPPSLPSGAQFVLLEGNPAEAVPLTFRLKFPPNYRVPPHWHTVLEHVTVLSGGLHIGMGERATYSAGTTLTAGSFAVMPEKMVHYAWTGPDGAVFQLHSVGPWTITYVNPADDPRKPRP